MKSQYLLHPRSIWGRLVPGTSSERYKIGCLFWYTFATTGAYVVGRAAADSLFLSRVGPDQLPSMYLLSAVVTILAAIAYAPLARRLPLKQTVLVTLVGLALSSILGFRLLLVFGQSLYVLAAIYLLAELRGGLNTIHYKILVSELLNDRHRQRTLGLLGAAATLAAIVLGAFCAYEARHLGTAALVCLAAGLELLAVIPILLLPRPDDAKALAGISGSSKRSRPFDEDAPRWLSFTDRNSSRPGSAYVGSIAALMASAVVVSTLIEYQWKRSGAASFAGKEDELAMYFGLFYAVVNLLTGIVQLLFTGRILRVFGTHYSLMVFPAALLMGTSAIAFFGSTHALFVILTCLKACDIFKRSINNPALLMLYAPLNKGVRRQAIVWVTGIIKPISEAASAVIIVLGAKYVGGQSLFLVVGMLLVTWILFTIHWRPLANAH